jgi:3-oxoacyl-[acyl-carrier protein] reductase
MNILVTGASRGLGLAICRLLLEEGHTIYAISRTYSESFSDLEKKYIGKVFFKSVDLSQSSEINKLVFKEFVSNKIVLHGLVNNAAFAYDDLITNLELTKLEDLFRVNTFSPMFLTKYAIRNMLFHKTKGSIVHISSISTQTGYKGLAMYAASKSAVEAFSKNTAREWGELGIRSNVIVAGFMETEMSKDLTSDQKTRIYNRTSLKEPTSALSVAETVAFILSVKSSSITGQNVNVDSGTI